MTPRRAAALLAAILLLPLAALARQDAKQQLNDQLYEAARRGDAAEVKALLDKGADVNAKFRYGATALFKAAERGHTDVVKLLIERGADVKVQDTFYRATAMTWALDKGHVEVVRTLLASGGGDVDGVLMSGARSGNAALVQVALDKGGAKPETLTAALTAAQKAEKPEIVEALKKAGAQPPPEVDAATLQTYAGRYKNEQGFEVVLAVKDGKLSITPGGQPPMELSPIDKATFRPIAFDATISFNVEAGKTTGFNFKQGTNTQLFKRVE